MAGLFFMPNLKYYANAILWDVQYYVVSISYDIQVWTYGITINCN
jgi:hypothetical protein